MTGAETRLSSNACCENARGLPTRRGSLLVVDDDEPNRDAVSRCLRQKGYDVTMAADGHEALALVDTATYDLVLLDIEMPGLSGLEVLSRLRSIRSQTQLPVIMITARPQGPDSVEALRLGANDYVTAPIDFPVALARIETHLSHKWAVESLRESEERYALAVVVDALTGLPNRLLFMDLLDRAIKRTQRRPDYVFALLVLGLDRFKAVNDSMGLLTADGLLAAVGRRFQTSLRSTDAVTCAGQGFTLARLGGDEFTVLIDDIADASDAVRVAERLRSALQEPFDVEGRQVFTSGTVGIALSTTGYDRPEEILRDAAIALHRAKAEGTTYCELFDTAMRNRAVSRLKIETDLRKAIEHQAFEVHYQPIISLGTKDIAGFEALVRWRHPMRGLVSPVEFIPVAEDTGMILQIGRLVLTESCRQMAAWQRRFGPSVPGVICVNVSSRQFADPELADHIETILQQTGLDPSSLKLEITEGAFLGGIRSAQGTLTRVQSMGIECSLDDFGTGYSSLSYLHKLQVDTVKVDRSFVSRIGLEDNGSEMVRAIVVLAHNLGMDVVAEGVETADQFEQLQTFGCEYAQGFYFSEPVDAATVGRLIATQPWRGLGQPSLWQQMLPNMHPVATLAP